MQHPALKISPSLLNRIYFKIIFKYYNYIICNFVFLLSKKHNVVDVLHVLSALVII